MMADFFDQMHQVHHEKPRVAPCFSLEFSFKFKVLVEMHQMHHHFLNVERIHKRKKVSERGNREVRKVTF